MKYLNYLSELVIASIILTFVWIGYNIKYIAIIGLSIFLGYHYYVRQEARVKSYVNYLVAEERITNKVLDSLDRVDSIKIVEKRRDSLLKIELNGNCNW